MRGMFDDLGKILTAYAIFILLVGFFLGWLIFG